MRGAVGLVLVVLLLVVGGWVAIRLLSETSDTGGGKALKPPRIVPAAGSGPGVAPLAVPRDLPADRAKKIAGNLPA